MTVAIYETFGRMSQPWINNLCEVDWHGANGSIVMGPKLAADRYTEARLSKAAEEGMLKGIKKNTKMILNFSEDAEMPEVLPAIFPRLLVNGSQGIGVSIANTWAPMNLKEVGDIILTYLKEDKLEYKELFDFPSGGVIVNKKDLIDIHKTGKGKIVLRGKATIDGNKILITELPYQVYVEPFVTSVVELIEKEKIDGIDDIINKTDKNNMLIEVICDKNPNYVLNKLYKLTDLEVVINPNQYALVSKTPTLLNLQQYIDIYVKHNLECIKREAQYDLAEAQKRLEIVEGLIIAIGHIDRVIEIIKSANDNNTAQSKLIKEFGFTDRQAKAIVDMRLGRLSKLETKEFEVEKDMLTNSIAVNQKIIDSEDKRKEILYIKLKDFIDTYSTPRRTELTDITPITEEELVSSEDVVIVVTENNNIKRVNSSTFKPQQRGGKGTKAQTNRTKWIFNTNTADMLLIFTSKGYVCKVKVNDLPEGDNTSKGLPIESYISLDADEEIMAMTCMNKKTSAQYCMFLTKKGLIKKLAIDDIGTSARKARVISFNPSDALVSICFVNDEEKILIISRKGYSVRTRSENISTLGKLAKGVKGINLTEGDEALTIIPITPSITHIAIVTDYLRGKRLPLSEYPLYNRGAKGVKTIPKGILIGAVAVSSDDNLIVHGKDKVICISSTQLPESRRSSVGNMVMDTEEIIAISKV